MKKLLICAILLLCAIHRTNCWTELAKLTKAQNRYHNTPEYIKYREFKQQLEQDSKLGTLGQQFFDLHRKCIEQNSSIIPGFNKKGSPECIAAKKLASEIATLKSKLGELEEDAAQTKEGQEYFHLLSTVYPEIVVFYSLSF